MVSLRRWLSSGRWGWGGGLGSNGMANKDLRRWNPRKCRPRWWFQTFFIFTPNLGEDFQFDEHIFQMGGSTSNQRHVQFLYCLNIASPVSVQRYIPIHVDMILSNTSPFSRVQFHDSSHCMVVKWYYLTPEQWKKPWLFSVYRGLYYPVI